MPKTKKEMKTKLAVISTENPTATLAPSFTDMIGSNTIDAKTAKKKKDDAPVIELPEELISNLTQFIEAKSQKKLAESTMEQASQPIIRFCKGVQDTKGFLGDYHNAYEVMGNDNIVKFIATDKYSVSQEAEHLNQLKIQLGEKYNEAVETEKVVELKSEVFANPTLQAELVSLIGTNFSKFFITKTKIIAKKGLNEKIYAITVNPEKLEMVREIVVQSSPYLK